MGVFGVYGAEKASSVIYYGLHGLQHRGQEGAGISVFDSEGNFYHHKGLGLINEVFNGDRLSRLKGHIGIGTTQYANVKKGGLDNVEPLYFHHRGGDMCIAGDGSLVNSSLIREFLESRGTILHTMTDSELLANLIKKDKSEDRIFNIVRALNMVEGGFAFLIMTKNRIYACRDKYGIKPLVIGKLGDGYVVSSESCSFELIGATLLRDVAPGEIVTIDEKGLRSRQFSQFKRHKMCGMEYIYLARPDSDMDGCNVHNFRKESGRILARECPADVDIVVGVPDSSLSAAMGYSEESGIPYEMGLVKNRYVARTFIQPLQEMREKGVSMKLSAVRSVVNGKRLVLVDDSIVRGTTSIKIINILRNAGAKEVHVRIASPMMTHPCYYGVDTSTKEELLCNGRTLEEACKAIGADSLGYISAEGCRASTFGCSELCLACFDGEYPTDLYQNKE
ncbi:MAG: amidophosphoribosyltransferase [Bacteroidales bacterium]|jgi:amidophosphoribosyltransferase|nr:amidophosphoribosyltransferase [Bacteroidales bacterium]MBQ1937850.1 amidophosphoribosyltransferase [Bacteroidales bacterium]MBQ2452276.1 amidophosphoribosyltransferase [Bacteroidales bacterium]